MPLALPAALSTTGDPAAAALFGGNILAPRAAMTGDGSYAEAVAALNVTGLRYPGGSLTEYYFSLTEPDAATAIHAVTGAETAFIPLSEFMTYAGASGHAVTIVLPTRDQLSEVRDETGNRLPQIDEEDLRDFLHDLVTGVYGEAEIAALEIGNEYWGSGEMTAVEYGRLAAQMAEVIADELALVAEVQGIDTSEIRVLAQMGQNYGASKMSEDYSGWTAEEIIADLAQTYPRAGLSSANIRGNGEVNWSEVTNALLRMGFETEAQQDALDGIIAHVYARGSEASRSYDLDVIRNSWLEQEGLGHLEVHVTEWNLKSSEALDAEHDYGLLQAQEMLEIVEEFLAAGVDQAHVWPLIQNTPNALATGFSYEGSTVPGAMFSLMAEAIPGKTLLDFTPAQDATTEAQAGDIDVHGFAGQGELLLYLTAQGSAASHAELDLSGLVSGFGSMEITLLGVADGAAAGDSAAIPQLQRLDPQEVYREGVLEVSFGPHEILQVVLRDVLPSEAFAPLFEVLGTADAGADPDADPGADAGADPEAGAAGLETILPVLAPAPPPPDAEDGADDGDSEGGSGWAEVGMLLALLPLVGLLGL
ncbi:hypothetical protein [Salipiger mangrovisoli]|uniref:Type I secretion C-terminal target domain (VC_A0849 subclass) n=1 Tax=Salipiger mangrovisoli TaxID=2865933 RepID=A0ABR9XA91_9RHOB|nr:hypothetical protein [Salipiger mangrovisoli]MBE9640534.1 hypothetical protein [Salipiger mangrovisoli]